MLKIRKSAAGPVPCDVQLTRWDVDALGHTLFTVSRTRIKANDPSDETQNVAGDWYTEWWLTCMSAGIGVHVPVKVKVFIAQTIDVLSRVAC